MKKSREPSDTIKMDTVVITYKKTSDFSEVLFFIVEYHQSFLITDSYQFQATS